MQGVDQDQLRDDNACSLEVDRVPAIMTQIGDFQHRRINELREVGQKPFEGCKKGWIIKGPFGGRLCLSSASLNIKSVTSKYLMVPSLDRQRVSDSEPIPVDLEIGRLAKKLSVLHQERRTAIARDVDLLTTLGTIRPSGQWKLSHTAKLKGIAQPLRHLPFCSRGCRRLRRACDLIICCFVRRLQSCHVTSTSLNGMYSDAIQYPFDGRSGHVQKPIRTPFCAIQP